MSNETSSFSSLSRIPILTGSTDYARRSLAIKNVAMMADIWEYLDGTETYPEVAEDEKPTTDEKAAIKAWKKANSKALGLMGSVRVRLPWVVSHTNSKGVNQYWVISAGDASHCLSVSLE